MVRHLGVGGGPTQMQVVRYQLKGRELVRSASQPLASLAEVDDALHHMDAFARVVVSNDARSMQLSVWIPPGGWTTSRPPSNSLCAVSRAARHQQLHVDRRAGAARVRFLVTMGAPAVEYVRTIPIGQ